MIVKDKNDLYFIHLQKTGGTSVRAVMLKEKCKYGSCSKQDDWLPRHETVKEARKRRHNFDSLISFSIIRNPYERLVSYFFYNQVLVKGPHFNGKFSDWVEHKSNFRVLGTQWSQLYFEGELGVKKLLRFETLKKDWNDLALTYGMSTELFHFLKTPHRPWQNYYTQKTASIVSSFFHKDFEKFDYHLKIQ